jgi:hypothetical protein
MKQTSNATICFMQRIFVCLYCLLLERTDFLALLFSFDYSFFLLTKSNRKNNFNFLILISVLFRLLFIFSLPNLSQDFYRFIWDGRLILLGLNPFTNLPMI